MPMNAMQVMFNTVLKNMGIDPDSLMEKAKELFDRFHKLETRLEGVTDERLVELEAEIIRLKEHLGMDEPEPIPAEQIALPLSKVISAEEHTS